MMIHSNDGTTHHSNDDHNHDEPVPNNKNTSNKHSNSNSNSNSANPYSDSPKLLDGHKDANATTNADDDNNNDNKNTKQESVVFILRQIISLLKISLQTSSKVVNPAIQQFVQTIIPALVHSYQQLAPVRLQEWLQIFIAALQNFFRILSQTPQGKQVRSEIQALSSYTLHLLTSVHTRQLIIEAVGLHVKAFEALNTPAMKTFLTSLPVFFIRFLDNVSSGDAKLLYHSVTKLIWSVIELCGRDETTLALAEVTALLVNALERERECNGPWNRKRVRGVSRGISRMKTARRRGGIGGWGSGKNMKSVRAVRTGLRSGAASNSKRRRERNAFISETYTDRVLLQQEEEQEGDVTVEDAILSSLGDGTGTYSENALWMALGRRGESNSLDGGNEQDDMASLPSRVVLPPMERSRRDDDDDDDDDDGAMVVAEESVERIPLEDLEVDFEEDVEDEPGNVEEDIDTGTTAMVDISYLQKRIQSRREKMDGVGQSGMYPTAISPAVGDGEHASNHIHSSTQSVAGSSSVVFSDELESEQTSIEDLEVCSAIANERSNTSQDRAVMAKKTKKKKMSIALEHEKESVKVPLEEYPHKYTFENKKENEKNIQHTTRGAYSSSAASQFYRTLEEVQNKLRHNAVLKALKSSHDTNQYPGVSGVENTGGAGGEKQWRSKAAAAAGAGNEQGQNLLRRSMTRGYSRISSQPIRYRPLVDVQETTRKETKDDTKKIMTLAVIVKSIFRTMPKRRKIVIVGTLGTAVFIALVWFILGCYGLYFLIREVYSKKELPVISSEPAVREIVLRIVSDPGVDVERSKEAISHAAANAIKNAIIGDDK